MAKSTHRGASKSSQPEHGGSWGGLLLLGFVLGVVSTLGVQYLFNSNGTLPLVEPEGMAGDEGDESRNFEFYTLLNDMQVQVPDSDIQLAADDNIIYWLQAGSFRSTDDAENLRVNLILQNMEAEVRPVSNNGELWHRVVVGPFETRTLANGAKEKLISDGLQPITLRQELP